MEGCDQSPEAGGIDFSVAGLAGETEAVQYSATGPPFFVKEAT